MPYCLTIFKCPINLGLLELMQTSEVRMGSNLAFNQFIPKNLTITFTTVWVKLSKYLDKARVRCRQPKRALGWKQ